MSDSEEDYMSDKFLAKCAKNDVRPGLHFRESDKRNFEIFKRELNVIKEPKKKLQEMQRLHEGLQTAISSDNKGFKMLEKMGYKSGSGIGKTSTGIKEPISISLKTNALGFGHVKHTKELKPKAREFQVDKHNYLSSRAEKLRFIGLKSDICKAQRLCEELDMKQGITYPQQSYLWQRHTIKALEKNKCKLKAANNVNGDDDGGGGDDGDDNDDGDDSDAGQYDNVHDDEDSSNTDVEDDIDQTELLKNIIMYLRLTYNYCMYCGDFIEDELVCPGYFRIDHE